MKRQFTHITTKNKLTNKQYSYIGFICPGYDSFMLKKASFGKKNDFYVLSVSGHSVFDS